MMVYIAGPIRGTKDYHERFATAAKKLRLEGHAVYNPAAANLEGTPLNRIMAHLLPQLCECEAIALLPGWSMSGGAQIEYDLAEYLGLRVIELF
jgi:hypothetical protein